MSYSIKFGFYNIHDFNSLLNFLDMQNIEYLEEDFNNNNYFNVIIYFNSLAEEDLVLSFIDTNVFYPWRQYNTSEENIIDINT